MEEAFDFDPLDGSTWADALQYDHIHIPVQDRRVASEIAARTLPMPAPLAIQAGYSVPLKTLLDGGALRTVLAILNDNLIAGLTLDELREDSGGNTCVPYVISVLEVLKIIITPLLDECEHPTCLAMNQHDRRTCQRCRAVEEMIFTIVSEYPKCTEVLWQTARYLVIRHVDCRTVLLEYDTAEKDNVKFGETLACIHFALYRIRTAFPSDTMKQAISRVEASSARLQLAIWVYAKSPTTQEFGLMAMMYTLLEWSAAACGEFIDEVTDGHAANKEDILSTTLTLLRNGSAPPTATVHLLRFIRIFHPISEVHLRHAVDRELFWYKMAVFRRHACMTSQTEYSARRRKDDSAGTLAREVCTAKTDLRDIASTVFMDICNALVFVPNMKDGWNESRRPLIPEVWLHEIILIMAIAIPSRFLSDGPRDELSPQYLDEIAILVDGLVTTLCEMFHYYQRHPSTKDAQKWVMRYPPSALTRLFTHMNWKATRNRLHEKRFNVMDRAIRKVRSAWDRLGHALTVNESVAASTLVREPPLGPLGRCGHVRCACNAFPPIHPLRVCRGCWAIAYCNASCQKDDWRIHQTVCRRGRRIT